MAGLKTTTPIKRMVQSGLLEARRRTNIEASWAAKAIDTSIPQHLTTPQNKIIDEIAPADALFIRVNSLGALCGMFQRGHAHPLKRLAL